MTIARAIGHTGENLVSVMVHSRQVDPLGVQPRRTQHLRWCSKDLLGVLVTLNDLAPRDPWLTPLASAHLLLLPQELGHHLQFLG